MIETSGLTKRFHQTTAVDGISFRAEPGEVLGFLGPNGAGKSTTMKMIAGFLAPTAGSARICGFNVENQPLEAKRSLGCNYSGPSLIPFVVSLSNHERNPRDHPSTSSGRTDSWAPE